MSTKVSSSKQNTSSLSCRPLSTTAATDATLAKLTRIYNHVLKIPDNSLNIGKGEGDCQRMSSPDEAKIFRKNFDKHVKMKHRYETLTRSPRTNLISSISPKKKLEC
jgi:hypothetical protein